MVLEEILFITATGKEDMASRTGGWMITFHPHTKSREIKQGVETCYQTSKPDPSDIPSLVRFFLLLVLQLPKTAPPAGDHML